jgi:hypothetical protein
VENFKELIIDMIFQTLFNCSPFYIKWEKHQEISVADKSINYRADYALMLEYVKIMRVPNLSGYLDLLSKIPFIIIECSKDPILPHFTHKDANKIASLMSIALMKMIECFHHMPISFLSGLFVQGVLVGGFDLEFLVMKPEFSASSNDDDDKILVSFLLKSSRRHCRFSLYSNGVYKHDLKDISVYCSLEEGYKYVPPMSHETIDSGNESELEEAIMSIDSDEKALFTENSGAINPGPVDEFENIRIIEDWDSYPSKSEITGMVKYMLNHKKRDVDLNTLLALTRVRDMALELFQYLKENVPRKSDSYDDDPRKFVIPAKTYRAYSDSRSRSFTFVITPGDDPSTKCADANITPVKENTVIGNNIDWPLKQRQSLVEKQEVRFRPKYHYVRDPHGFWVIVVKSLSELEVPIFSCPLIRSSRFFPRLHPEIPPKIECDKKALTLAIERIYPLSRIHRFSDNISELAPCFDSLLQDGIEALTVLHKAGFIHCDISPNNIGYNDRIGNWQIFDFDQSILISKPEKFSKVGGTRNFVSPNVLKTGIFRPIDDFISLVLSIQNGFPEHFASEYNFNRFSGLMNEILSSSEVNPNWSRLSN